MSKDTDEVHSVDDYRSAVSYECVNRVRWVERREAARRMGMDGGTATVRSPERLQLAPHSTTRDVSHVISAACDATRLFRAFCTGSRSGCKVRLLHSKTDQQKNGCEGDFFMERYRRLQHWA